MPGAGTDGGVKHREGNIDRCSVIEDPDAVRTPAAIYTDIAECCVQHLAAKPDLSC